MLGLHLGQLRLFPEQLDRCWCKEWVGAHGRSSKVCVAVGGCDRAGKDKIPCAAGSVLRLKKTLLHGCKSVVLYCVWISSLAGKKPSPYCQEFRAGSMEHEYILRVVQRAGEKAVKCLKSRGRQKNRSSAAVVATVVRGRECPECWKLLSCAYNRAQEFHTAVRNVGALRGHEYSEDGMSC